MRQNRKTENNHLVLFELPENVINPVFRAAPSQPLFHAALLDFRNVSVRSPMFSGSV